MTAGKHFNELLGRYGSPVVVINLVKKRETRRHETLLSEEFTKQACKSIWCGNRLVPPVPVPTGTY